MSTISNIHIFALAAHGEGISGGDRIFMEFAKEWSKNYPVTIYVWEEGYQILLRQHLISVKGKVQSAKLKIQVVEMKPWNNFGFFINYLARIIKGIGLGLSLKLENQSSTIIYSASEFWMDSLPAFILKKRFPKMKWITAWYQTAPKPWIGYTEGKRHERYTASAFLYWLVQLLIKPLVAKFADDILVNNEEEKKQFPKHDANNKAIVVLGAVDIKEIGKWKIENGKLPKVYDAVFQGRFHPQKGVLELIDIWKMVVDKLPGAKLVMIGDGPLMERVKGKVKREKLEKNIKLTGYLFDGEEKYKLFAQSKIVVHPAFYDSGGMASLEAMAFGLPAVGFNLKSFDDYYPEGMEKVRSGDLQSFANKILEFLGNKNLYDKVQKQALHLITDKYSWEYRSRQILAQVLE